MSALWGFGQTLPVYKPLPKSMPRPVKKAKVARQPNETRTCAACGVDFKAQASAVRDGRGIACSVSCGAQARAGRTAAAIRARILETLRVGGLPASEISKRSNASPPTTLSHLRALAAAGTVESKERADADGRYVHGDGWWLTSGESVAAPTPVRPPSAERDAARAKKEGAMLAALEQLGIATVEEVQARVGCSWELARTTLRALRKDGRVKLALALRGHRIRHGYAVAKAEAAE